MGKRPPVRIRHSGTILRFPLFRARQTGKGVIGLYGGWAKRAVSALLALLLCTAAAGAVTQDGGRMLVPVGHTVGVKLFSKGVMVVKLPDGGTPARACGLRTGDVIVQCGDTPVTSAEQFQSLLQEEGPADLQIDRNGGSFSLRVEPERNEQGVYCIGAWIRDSMAGIGTMTYYDPEDHSFGALGIADVDTALLMPFYHGSVLPSTVKAVKRGESGSAGELRGDFDLDTDLGTLYANTDRGIFGTLTDLACPAVQGQALPVGTPVSGSAEILSNVQGDQVASYSIEIGKITDQGDGRDMMITVTDPALLELTGGIVQGMSGSPILQNGKLVGAVTHVLLRDPARGYGISMEKMLAAA